jgi:DNA-directed RNA polymerase specialized sigma24 family protein
VGVEEDGPFQTAESHACNPKEMALRLAKALLRMTSDEREMWSLLAVHGLAALAGEGELPEGVIPLWWPKSG